LGAITVSYKGKTIVLTPDQALASVSGRLVSLPAPPTRNGRRWLVPVEFISRALGLIYDARLDLRKPSRLLVIGDLRVPRLTARPASPSTWPRSRNRRRPPPLPRRRSRHPTFRSSASRLPRSTPSRSIRVTAATTRA